MNYAEAVLGNVVPSRPLSIEPLHTNTCTETPFHFSRGTGFISICILFVWALQKLPRQHAGTRGRRVAWQQPH